MRGDERGNDGGVMRGKNPHLQGEIIGVLGGVRTHIPRVRAVTGVQLKYLLVIIVP